MRRVPIEYRTFYIGGMTGTPSVAALLDELFATGRFPGARPDPVALVARDPTLGDLRFHDDVVAGPHGPVPIRRYEQRGAATSALVWVHGGAFLAGDLDMPEAHRVSLVLAARGILVVSVDYRKVRAGVRHPVPSDDVLAAWRSVTAEHPGLAWHLGGASAGANLAAGAVRRLRDAGDPLPASAILVYPLLHPHLPPLTEDARAALAGLPPAALFDDASVQRIVDAFAGPDRRDDPIAFPGLGDLTGLPPTLVIAAGADTLRSSAETYVRDLAAAGGDVTAATIDGAPHGFLDDLDDPHARGVLDRIAVWIAECSAEGIGKRG